MYIFLISFIYSIHIIQVFSFVCVLTWPLLGIKNAWPRSVSFRGLIQNFRQVSSPLSYVEPPPGKNLSPLGTKLYFHVNSARKKFYCIDQPTWPPCHMGGGGFLGKHDP